MLLKEAFQKCTIVFLMLQILNLSIYNSDFYGLIFDENASMIGTEDNPIDSFAELILEEFVGIDNAFPEDGNANSDKSANLKQQITLKLIAMDNFPTISSVHPNEKTLKKKYPHIDENYKFLFVNKISHPPAFA